MILAALADRLDATAASMTATETRLVAAVHTHHAATREAHDVAALIRRDEAASPPRARAVLVIDDTDADRTTLVGALRARLDTVAVHGVESVAAARVALQRVRYAVLVVDYHLSTGESGLAYARSLPHGTRAIVVTGRAGESLAALRRIGRHEGVPVLSRPVEAHDWDAFAAEVRAQVDDATE